MELATIVYVGFKHPTLEARLIQHGYRLEVLPDIAAIASQTQNYVLIIIHQLSLGDMSDAIMEQLYFLGFNTPCAVLLNDPEALNSRQLSRLRNSTLEFLYENEISCGLIINHIDRFFVYTQLDRTVAALYDKRNDREQLQEELTLRSSILEREREINANLLKSITMGLMIIDNAGTVVESNVQARTLLSLSSDDIVGETWQSIVPAGIHETITSLLAVPDSADTSSHSMLKIRFQEIVLQFGCFRMFDYQKRPTGIILLISNITEQEAITSQLYQAEKLATVGTMLSGIAHELRNPLSIISARIQRALQPKERDAEWTKKNLESIETQVQRCASIIDNLLNFTRSRATATGYHNLSEILDEALTYVTYQNTFDDIAVVKKYLENLMVYGERSRFVQVFLNIFTNAADAMNYRGTITINTCSLRSEGVLIEINDTGPGIDPAMNQKVFDPFFTTKDPGKGTGLGLAIVYKIVTESQGSIWFSSKPGNTSFFIKLPAAKDPCYD